MAPQVGGLERHHDEVPDADGDLLVATRAEVRLGRLVRLDPANL